MNPRVIEVQPIENFRLLLTFSNNEKRFFDVKPYLALGIFKELEALEIFNSAKTVDGSVQWCNDADFCPDTLYLESISALSPSPAARL